MGFLHSIALFHSRRMGRLRDSEIKLRFGGIFSSYILVHGSLLIWFSDAVGFSTAAINRGKWIAVFCDVLFSRCVFVLFLIYFLFWKWRWLCKYFWNIHTLSNFIFVLKSFLIEVIIVILKIKFYNYRY